jgi:hypothetical protein
MRRTARVLVVLPVILGCAAPAVAQTVVATPAEVARYDRAPWWMDKPIIASSGYVRAETLANRANFVATYQVVDRDQAAATKAAAAKVKALGGVLAAFGPDKVRTETTFDINPLYDQYRDKDGALIDNERADKIKSYQVSARVAVEVRDVRLVEQVYATALAAKPSTAGDVSFRLEPDNEARTQMFKEAVQDATRRARMAAEATGAKLGAVRLIDPTGRACETDVLVAGANRGAGEVYSNRVYAAAPPPQASVEEMVVTSQRRAVAAGLDPEEMRLPLQPPLVTSEARACVVFALG